MPSHWLIARRGDYVLVGLFQANTASPKAWYPRARDATAPVKGASLTIHPAVVFCFRKAELKTQRQCSPIPDLNRVLRREAASRPGCWKGLFRPPTAKGLQPKTPILLFRISPPNLAANVLATTPTTSQPQALEQPHLFVRPTAHG